MSYILYIRICMQNTRLCKTPRSKVRKHYFKTEPKSLPRSLKICAGGVVLEFLAPSWAQTAAHREAKMQPKLPEKHQKIDVERRWGPSWRQDAVMLANIASANSANLGPKMANLPPKVPHLAQLLRHLGSAKLF